jgi:hypothetical protein
MLFWFWFIYVHIVYSCIILLSRICVDMVLDSCIQSLFSSLYIFFVFEKFRPHKDRIKMLQKHFVIIILGILCCIPSYFSWTHWSVTLLTRNGANSASQGAGFNS